MLSNLLVKNIALVKEAEVEFHSGLNIMTGETGAGKSVILGAINLALGMKAGPDYIGQYGDSAYVELTFHVTDADELAFLEAQDVETLDGDVVISRKLLPNKSIMKINGETCNQSNVRKITETLLDIHGQHDHQSLLYKEHHLDILDRFARNELAPVKQQLADAYKDYHRAIHELENFSQDETERVRDINFITFELNEINEANLLEQEDEILEQQYSKMVNSKRITEEMGRAYSMIGSSEQNSASDLIGRAYLAMSSVEQYDPQLNELLEQLSGIDSLLNDLSKEVSDYLEDLEYDEAEFFRVEKRLNEINHLKLKYGRTLGDIITYRDELQDKLDFYSNYEEGLEKARRKLQTIEEEVKKLCEQITSIRTGHIKALEEAITQALVDLNFEQVEFRIMISPASQPSPNGQDEVEFMISLNPGEPCKPLSRVASGGELSRIMLGIKSVMAGKDDIDTLIFDEIDTGISGRTAQKVSQKMAEIATKHQIICITHLPQIAAMADTHFLIEKHVEDSHTQTTLSELADNQIVAELSRMLGGLEITDVVTENARQMKAQADVFKRSL